MVFCKSFRALLKLWQSSFGTLHMLISIKRCFLQRVFGAGAWLARKAPAL